MASTPTPSRSWIIGDFRFDPSSGELRPEGDGEKKPVRLPPQPARLLELLAQQDGGLLTREEIRTELWPEVHVDFDQSLNFCIHQVRSALGDAAGAPRYIETLPRRGYRLKQPARPLAEEPSPIPGSTARGQGRTWVAAAVLAFAALLAWWALSAGKAPAPPRLAVTPFQPAEGVIVQGEPSRVAEEVLLDLGNLGPEVVAVLGPATTSRYGGSFPELDRMARELELDYVVNGRFLAPEGGSGPSDLLVELIRASDGAHVWVNSFPDVNDPAAVARRIAEAVKGELNLQGTGRGPP